MSASPAFITHPLLPFARSGDGPVHALVASVDREGEGTLHFRYVLDADLKAIRIPAVRASRHVDELWKHTCFEAFIACAAPARSDGYVELNFSPSTEWAAYSFESYRKGMTPVALMSQPRIEITRAASQLRAEARVETLRLLPENWRRAGVRLRIALSAVIETETGQLSCWALEHAPGKPDFHHAAGFILEV